MTIANAKFVICDAKSISFLKIIIPNGKEKCTWGENFFLHFQTSKRTLPEELHEIKNGKWSSKIFLIYIFFLNVGPSKEGIFLTTFYGLYFSHSFFYPSRLPFKFYSPLSSPRHGGHTSA